MSFIFLYIFTVDLCLNQVETSSTTQLNQTKHVKQQPCQESAKGGSPCSVEFPIFIVFPTTNNLRHGNCKGPTPRECHVSSDPNQIRVGWVI